MGKRTFAVGILAVGLTALSSGRSVNAQCQMSAFQFDESAAGGALAIDGDLAVAGSRNDDGAVNSSGAAYIYRRDPSSGLWAQEAKLFADDGGSNDWFGEWVDICGDVVVVGARNHDDPFESAGAAYVFRHIDGRWIQEAELHAPDAQAFDWFGDSVAIHNDVIVVGSTEREHPGKVFGAAYIFIRDQDTGLWNAEAAFPPPGGFLGYFGWSVDVFDDVAVIGMRHDNGFGSAHVYRGIENGPWIHEATVQSKDIEFGDEFGWVVSIHGDAFAVGAHDQSAVYIFRDDGEGAWAQEQRIWSSQGAGDFGKTCALEGDTIIIGIPDKPALVVRGVVFVFRYTGRDWVRTETFGATAHHMWDFGGTVAVSGETILVGEIHGDTGAFQFFDFGQPDCDRNHRCDIAEISSGFAIDCDDNGVPDGCEEDCNNNGVLDACDIADGTSLDCNDNGIPDECDVAPPFRHQSEPMGPVIPQNPMPVILKSPPPAIGMVRFRFEALASLGSFAQFIEIFLDGNLVGRAFISGDDLGCLIPQRGSERISAGTFNQYADGKKDVKVTYRANPQVFDCSDIDSYLIATIEYLTLGDDLNGNGIPDSCESYAADLDGDGIVDSADLLMLLGIWGACDDCGACLTDLDGDCAVGASDLIILLGNWSS